MTDLAEYIDKCIYEDYLIGILITSAAEGRISSLGMDYGPGKSTLLLQIAYVYLNDWDLVFKALHQFPWEIEEFLQTAPRRILGVPVFFLMDDMQSTLGKERSRDPYVRSLKNRMTRARTRLAIFMGTAPDIGQLAKPWRYFFNFELIIPYRGTYEVQRLRKIADFHNPYDTRAHLDYSGETLGATFKPLPKDIQKRYDNWRDEQDRRLNQGEDQIRLGSIQNVLTESSKELLAHLIKKEGLRQETIIWDLDQRKELRILKITGLVEFFGDVVLPTQNAKRIAQILNIT
jgi:hypothetical protein